jgi:hypothetical protein
MRSIIFVLIAILLSAVGYGQLSPAGTYLGRLGTNDVVVGVSRSDTLAFYHFDRGARRTELGIGTISAQGRVLMSLNTGRALTLMLSGSSVSGTLGGVAFTASLESPLGPFASKAFGYTGTMANPVADINVLSLVILPSGKAALISSNPVDGIHGGIGSINAAGTVSVVMSNGNTWSLLLAPVEGVNNTPVTSSAFGSRQSILVQLQRPPIINIATRGTVGGSAVLTAGFVTTTAAKVLLIRAVGPTLGALGVDGVQSDPVLTLFSGSSVIAQNDNWGSAPNAVDITAASAQVGAFALSAGSRDAVLLVTLEPGAYTAQVTGLGPTGDGLVEVYEVR